MNKEIRAYNDSQVPGDKAICASLAKIIDKNLPEAENKIWHRHPVWFLDGNPIVGYSKLKAGIRLMFWSGASGSQVVEGKDKPELQLANYAEFRFLQIVLHSSILRT